MEKEFDEKVTSVCVDAGDYNVSIKTGRCCTVMGERLSEDFENICVENGTLEIVRKKSSIFDRLFGKIGKDTNITIILTEGRYEQCIINNISGDVNMEDGCRFENMRIDAVSGDISVDNASVEGRAELSSVSGDIRINGLTCSNLKAKSTSGDVSVCGADVSGKLWLRTVSGMARLNNVLAEGIEIETISGDISGTLKGEYAYSVHSVSGAVFVPESVGARHCDVHTTSGSVKIREDGR